MGPAADRLAGPGPRELWLTVGLSVLLHGLLTLAVVVMPRFHFGHYITVPVTYTVNLVSDPGSVGRTGPAPTPASPTQPAAPPKPVPAPVPRVAAPPPARPSDELTLPNRQARQEAKLREPEPSLRLPAARPEPVRPTPATPRPAPAAPPTASVPAAPSAPTAKAGGGTQASGIEVASPGSGAGGSALGYYLTLLDRKIQDNWIPLGAGAGRETMVVVRFRVLRSGQVRDIELESGSGDSAIDVSAMRAIRQSLPLPPFPNLLTDASLDLRYKFVTER
ncbi:MAG TPA: TonB family protein [Candidatus Sulfotelmatobacter sp.]|nr:TonB family protein [Candidatus Sulfotelmatobacter sp.]